MPVHIRTYIHICVDTDTFTHMQTHAYTHTQINIQTYTYIHMHTHKPIYPETHTCIFPPSANTVFIGAFLVLLSSQIPTPVPPSSVFHWSPYQVQQVDLVTGETLTQDDQLSGLAISIPVFWNNDE